MCLGFLPCGLLASNRIDWTHPQGWHIPRNSNTRQLQFPSIFPYLGLCCVCSLFLTSRMASSDWRSGGIVSNSWWPLCNSVGKNANTGREQSVVISSSSTKSDHTIIKKSASMYHMLTIFMYGSEFCVCVSYNIIETWVIFFLLLRGMSWVWEIHLTSKVMWLVEVELGRLWLLI